MLTYLVAAALSGFAGALALGWLIPLPSAAHVHLALAAGVLPLIMGAMLHFAPVLTRSAAPGPAIQRLPWLAQGAGVLATLAFLFPDFLVTGRNIAATLGLAAAAMLAAWMRQRGRQALGSPHPGLNWYLAALACLMLALLAVFAMNLWPGHSLALKRFHLHLNTLGLIGLTAVGTVQVLLPTAAGRMDAQAVGRLRQDIRYALTATLLIAMGAAGIPVLAWAGLALWSVPLYRMLAAWLRLYPAEIFAWHGAVPPLAAAPLGLGLALFAGAWQGMAQTPASGVGHAFMLAFLLPLVTGAVSQLLPLWLRPGAQTPWHSEMRRRLGRWSGIRVLLFAGGGLAAASGWRSGILLAAAGLAWFIVQLLAALTYSAKIKVK